jgi:NAD(P)-dependent dehydrogenase (short-subunit alcohol dehydrogenase family)
MKIVIIGASGTIGSAVVSAFQAEHDVIKVGLTSGDYQINIADPSSIQHCLQEIKKDHGMIDALICATGKVVFNDFELLTEQDWQLGIANKMMGQINLVTMAKDMLVKGASITLTSGVLFEQHIKTGVSAAAINAAINAFVTSVAPVLDNNLRINCICPTLLLESVPIYKDYFPGFIPVTAKDVASAYVRSVIGIGTGQIFKVY